MSNQEEGTTRGLDSKQPPDSLGVALDAIGDRWSLHVVRAVAFGASRFTDILASVGAPRDVLSARLRTLVESGILERAHPERGRLSGYALTDKGRELAEVILVLKRWGDTYSDPSIGTLDITHDPCGKTFVARLHCQACGEPYHRGELSVGD